MRVNQNCTLSFHHFFLFNHSQQELVMSLFTAVEMAPRDPILGLNEQFNVDTNPAKVNLGVGVYYDDNGKLPLLACVQAAEKAMMEAPKARGYLPIDGIAVSYTHLRAHETKA